MKINGLALVVICVGIVPLLVVGIWSFLKLWGMGISWRVYGNRGNVFQGPTEWADINEAADRAVEAAHREEER
jgi:hypothetical protein